MELKQRLEIKDIKNEELRSFIESLNGKDEEEYFEFMDKQVSAGAEPAEACARFAAQKGYNITAEQINEMTKDISLSPNTLEGVSGGTCFTAGTPTERRKWNCSAHCANKYRTGNERETPRFIFWSVHEKEYHCPDCNSTWWERED